MAACVGEVGGPGGGAGGDADGSEPQIGWRGGRDDRVRHVWYVQLSVRSGESGTSELMKAHLLIHYLHCIFCLWLLVGMWGHFQMPLCRGSIPRAVLFNFCVLLLWWF